MTGTPRDPRGGRCAEPAGSAPTTYLPPVPIELPAASPARRAVRGAETIATFARHLGPAVAGRLARRPSPPADVGRRLRRTFESLGSTYVKFGQLLGSSPGAFGTEFSDEFRSCLDTGPAVPFPAVAAAVEAATGRPLADTFADFEQTPVAAGSIAVVHRAQGRDGTTVAVKVLRPHIADQVTIDLDIMEPLFKRLALSGIGVAGPLYRFLRGFRTQIAEELDLVNEARTMTHFRRLFAEAGLERIAVPIPFDELSGRDVLIMEYLDGVPVDDLAAIAELGHDPSPLVRDLLRSWFLTGLRHAVFHGDIHAGNLLMLRDGRIGMIDWGIVGRLDSSTHHLFRRFVEAVLGDETAWPDIVAFLSEHAPFPMGPEGRGIPDEAKEAIEDILTRPFGDVNLQGAFSGEGRMGDRRSRPATRVERRARRAMTRERRQRIIGSGFADTSFAQSNFMLFKQLLYFERYGKMYLAGEALMGDRPWLEQVLAASPDGAAPGRGPGTFVR